MADTAQAFMEGSPLAHRIRLGTRVVIQRTRLSPAELLRIKDQGEYGPVPREQQICELEVGGRIVARGKIVRRRGVYRFKVPEAQAAGSDAGHAAGGEK